MKPDKVYLFLASVLFVTILSWITSCTHDARIADLPQVCFDVDVQPIFATSCAISGCHDGHGEGMNLGTFAEISRGIVAGNPNGSKIYKAIITTWGENKMPPAQPLSLMNRTIIRVWIEQGALANPCPGVSAGTERTRQLENWFNNGSLNN